MSVTDVQVHLWSPNTLSAKSDYESERLSGCTEAWAFLHRTRILVPLLV